MLRKCIIKGSRVQQQHQVTKTNTKRRSGTFFKLENDLVAA